MRVHGSPGDCLLGILTGDRLGARAGDPSGPLLGDRLLLRLSLLRLSDRLGDRLGGRLGDLFGDRRDFREGERLTEAFGGGTGLEVLREMLGTVPLTLPRAARLLSVDS